MISLSSVKTLVCSNYFCHLLPTVANYCTNSLQGSNTHTQTHTFANTYTVCKSICKYHVTGQCPITWGQRGRGPAAWLDTTRDGQIGNRLFLTQVIRQPDRTRRAGAVGSCNHCASGVTSVVRTRAALKEPPHRMDRENGWMSAYWEEWMNGRCSNASRLFSEVWNVTAAEMFTKPR